MVGAVVIAGLGRRLRFQDDAALVEGALEVILKLRLATADHDHVARITGDVEAVHVDAADGLAQRIDRIGAIVSRAEQARRSEEHTSELQSLMRTSYADFC